MTNPVQKFDELASSASVLFLVYYRGHWCPFCMSYLKSLQSIYASAEKSDVKVVAVTSEPSSEIKRTREASGYHGTILNDPENVLASDLKRRFALDVAISEKKGYSHGMAQPAILVLQNDKVLYQWAIKPSFMNFGGAKDRPLLDQVWANVQAQLNGQSKAFETVGATSCMGLCKEKIFG